MANITPEKNKKATELSDEELGGVSGGVEQLRRGRTEKPGEVDDDELGGVSGGVSILKPIITDTDGEVDDGTENGNGPVSASVIPT